MHKPPQGRQLKDLVQIMETLLSPDGCPWDRAQTEKTLVPHAIEEVYELAEAIESGNQNAIVEELGDLLFQVIFHATLAQKNGRYNLEQVIAGICEKLVRRHTHVFGDVKVKSAEEALSNWNKMKSREKNQDEFSFNVPVSLPALQRAQKIGEKTKSLKFDWNSNEDVFKKVEEEFLEFKQALSSKNDENAKEEFGDLMFVLVQFARHKKWDAETLARGANRKFEGRFKKMMALIQKRGLEFTSLSTDEKESLWNEIKSKK